MVQKTIIDTLNKEGKSLLKGMAVQGALYQSIINAKLTGRKKLGRKMCTSNMDDHKLENKRKRTGLLLSGPKSSFQMKVHFAFHLEIKVPESGGKVERHRIHVAWSPVWSFHSQWWFGMPCYLLVLVHCVFWRPQSTQPSTRTFQRTSCLLLLTSFMEMLISFSWLGTCPHCQRYQKLVQWPWCYCAWLASKLAWPEPHRESILSSATGWLPPCHAALMQ